MYDWLWHVITWACAAFAVLQFTGGCWCFMELRRKWRSIPELWSIDWLDIVYRLERDFGVTITVAEFDGLHAKARVELTAGQLWELVAAKMWAAGSKAPADGWERVVAALSEALNVKPKRITPGSRLYADLGMEYGFQ